MDRPQSNFLFFGASQVFGWQGNYSAPNYPFGLEMAQLDKRINATILGLPGDCIGGSGCPANFPPGTGTVQQDTTTGFLARLDKFLSNNEKRFDWIVILGGSNDIIQSCKINNNVYIDRLATELPQIARLALANANKVLLLPPFKAPLFQSRDCSPVFDSFLSKFTNIVTGLNEKNVITSNTTSLISNYSTELFFDSLHLNKQGNFNLAQGILPITTILPSSANTFLKDTTPSRNEKNTPSLEESRQFDQKQEQASLKNSNKPNSATNVFSLNLNFFVHLLVLMMGSM